LLPKKTKLEKSKKDFVKYLFVAFVIQAIPGLAEYSFTNFLFDLLTILNVTGAITAGFSFYFYLFNKDKLALKTIPVLIGISLVAHTIVYAFIISDPILWGYFIDWSISIMAFFIGGLTTYALTAFLFWVYGKVKNWLNK